MPDFKLIETIPDVTLLIRAAFWQLGHAPFKNQNRIRVILADYNSITLTSGT